MKKIAVILAGCGSRDGSEINEAVLTLLSISQNGGSYTCFAPDRNQADCINHTNGQPLKDARNLLVEAARISRGKIKDLDLLKAADFDALIIPGGLGMAKNFSDYPAKGTKFTVNAAFKEIILDFHTTKKYIGGVCISPVLIAGSFKNSGFSIKITTGQGNESDNDAVAVAGASIVELPSSQVCIDEINRIITTPAYMNNAELAEIYQGIHGLTAYILQNC